jgi:hypothetical protein
MTGDPTDLGFMGFKELHPGVTDLLDLDSA